MKPEKQSVITDIVTYKELAEFVDELVVVKEPIFDRYLTSTRMIFTDGIIQSDTVANTQRVRSATYILFCETVDGNLKEITSRVLFINHEPTVEECDKFRVALENMKSFKK